MLPVLTRGTTAFPDTNDWVDREFGRLMRRFWGDGPASSSVGTIAYPVNIWEDDDNVYVEAEMPGFRRDEIDITLEQGVLNISAERKAEPQRNGSEILNERRYMRYYRSFSLPATVDDTNVEARLADGVLHLTMPKRAEVKPRRIKVN